MKRFASSGRYEGRLVNPVQAVQEARAILAETEPESAWDSYLKLPAAVGPWARIDRTPFARIMRDALSAFVASEVQ